MKACVVGAGFAGLAMALRLQKEGFELQLVDPLGIEGGASAAATGLMHPYVGQSAYRSRFAIEGMQASLELFELAQQALGEKVYQPLELVRIAETEKTLLQMQKNCREFADVVQIDQQSFLIKSAYVVFPEKYRQGLLIHYLRQNGALRRQKIDSLQELAGYDLAVLCTGYGSKEFVPAGEYQYIKGQALSVRLRQELSKAFVGKGYLCPTHQKNIACLGSTYEREFTDVTQDVELAERLLWSNGLKLYQGLEDAQIMGCSAGVRVCSKGLYLPKVTQLAPKIYLMTGYGSRGLLYHAYYAKKFIWES